MPDQIPFIKADSECRSCYGAGYVTYYDSVEFWGAPCSMETRDICDCVSDQLPLGFEGKFTLVDTDGDVYEESTD